jgi:hypothetical protein
VLGQDLEAVASRLAAAGRDGGPLQILTDEVRLQAGQPEAAILLVLDQMEELLGLSEAQASGRFLDVLRRALERGDGQFLVLATLRSEYLGEVQLLPFLTTPGPLPYREQTLDPVPLDRLDDIIRVPGQRWPQPVEFADRLVERMIRDTGTRDALPLLAFTLNRLWRDTAARADGVFQLEEYWRLGGLEGRGGRGAPTPAHAGRARSLTHSLRAWPCSCGCGGGTHPRARLPHAGDAGTA